MKDIIFNFSDLQYEPKRFINEWSSKFTCKLKHDDYLRKSEQLYIDNIDNGLDDYESFMKLWQWKNGLPKFSKQKLKIINSFWSNLNVLRELRRKFSWEKFEETFDYQRNTFWIIFLLHIISKEDFPIWDRNSRKFYNLYCNGIIIDETMNAENYPLYKNYYINWFNNFKTKNNLNGYKMSIAFFELGNFLKSIEGYPITIYDYDDDKSIKLYF